jgi:hypothetical protein
VRPTAGDQPFRRRRLRDLVAAAASVFRTGDAYDAQLRRHPVQHLPDAFADGMERTTTTAADITGDCEQNVLARQMIGQRFAFRASVFGLGDDYRAAPGCGQCRRRGL